MPRGVPMPHARVLVPLGIAEADADVGTFAEALLYFDQVDLLVAEAAPLATLLDWFIAPGEVETLLLWLRDGVVRFADAEADTGAAPFVERVLKHPRVAAAMLGQFRHARLLSFSKDRVFMIEPANQGAVASASSRMLRAALQLHDDLFLSPAQMTSLTGGLAADPDARAHEVSIEFPAVRRLVNEGRVDLREVIDLRRRSRGIRAGLQRGDHVDRDAFVALHNSAGRDSPWRLSRALRWCDVRETLIFEAS
jgi:hypothetical protein